MCATLKPVHSNVNPCARPRSAIPLRAGSPTHRVWLLVVAAFYVRGERESCVLPKIHARTTHGKVSGNVHEAYQQDRQSRAAICFKALPGGIVLCAGWDMKHSFCPRPRQNAEKCWCFRGKKVTCEIVFLGLAFHTNFAQTQLLTQLLKQMEPP